MRIWLILWWLSLGCSSALWSAPYLVKDIQNVAGSASTEFGRSVTLGTRLLFTARNADGECWLWVTQGTTSTTQPLKLLGRRSPETSLLVVAGRVYFVVTAANGLGQLWSTDSTETGTRVVYDGGGGSSVQDSLYSDDAEKVYFFSQSSQGKRQWIWETDGTTTSSLGFVDFSSPLEACGTAGEELVFLGGLKLWVTDRATGICQSLNPPGGAVLPWYPLAAQPGAFFFVNTSFDAGEELWFSNGTPSGTHWVKELTEGSIGDEMVWLGGKLYFSVSVFTGSGYQAQLWCSDGSTEGTAEVLGGTALSTVTDLRNLRVENERVFFMVEYFGQKRLCAFHPQTGTAEALAVWDGVVPPGLTTALFYPAQNLSGELYFSSQARLKATDGTAAGTRLVVSDEAATFSHPYVLGTVGTTLFFTAETLATGQRELYRTDGTQNGTLWVSDAIPESDHLGQWQVFLAPTRLLFKNRQPGSGAEMWVSNGTTGGTFLLKDISTGTADAKGPESSSPHEMLAIGETVYFSADDGVHGPELWKSDGTSGGTLLVKDLVAGSEGSSPTLLTQMGGNLYFATSAGLWRSDGTAVGTVLISEEEPGQIVATADRLYFFSLTPPPGTRFRDALWCSDGTAEGTVLLKDTLGGMMDLAILGDEAFFLVLENSSSANLWKTDGTVPGTVLVKTVLTGSLNLLAGSTLTRVGDHLHFLTMRQGASSGTWWWQSDGTPEGTVQVQKVSSNTAGSSSPAAFFPVSQGAALVLYFEGNPFSLWVTDGAGTGAVSVSTSQTSWRKPVVGYQNSLYWTDGWVKLYQSAGSDETTGLLLDAAGKSRNFSGPLIEADGRLFWFGSQKNYELWTSDGTATGTRMVTPLPGQGLGTLPVGVVATNSRLFYFQSQARVGRELHAILLQPELNVASEVEARLPHQSVVSCGEVFRGTTAPVREFSLKNTGMRPLTLTGYALEGPNDEDFTLLTGDLSRELLPGEELGFTIQATPLEYGIRTAKLTLFSDDPGTPAFEVLLSTRGLYVPPEITQQPVSRLALPAEAVAFSSGATGDDVIYEWFKDGASLLPDPAAETPQIEVPAVAEADVAVYRLQAQNPGGTVFSDPAYLALIQPTAETDLTLIRGDVLSLDCVVSAPESAIITYRWQRDGVDLTDAEAGVSGAGTSMLTITEIRGGQTGRYDCHVQMKTEGGVLVAERWHGETQVEVITVVPEIQFIWPEVYVGQNLELPVPTQPLATSFSAEGLPPGLVMDPDTGVIRGQVSAVKSYKVRITVANGIGTNVSPWMTWAVRPLPVESARSYEALIAPGSSNAQLGGWMRFTVNAKGSLSGSAVLAGKKYPFKGALFSSGDAGRSLAYDLRISRGSLSPLPFTLNIESGSVSGLLRDEAVQGWVAPYSSKNPAPLAGAVNTALLATETDPESANSEDHPQGHGYAVANVSSKGSVTWKGVLADGTPFTASHLLGAQGAGGAEEQVPSLIHVPLYKATGSFQGSFHFLPDAQLPLLEGSAEWLKLAQAAQVKTRSYRAGFGPLSLDMRGALHRKPAPGEDVLGLEAEPNNACVLLDQGGLDDMISQLLSITPTGKTKVELGTPNPALITLAVKPATGHFSGTFTLRDPHPVSGAKPVEVVRKTKFAGLIVKHPEVQAGVGHFNLAELPDTPGEKLTATPLQSGRVWIGTED